MANIRKQYAYFTIILFSILSLNLSVYSDEIQNDVTEQNTIQEEQNQNIEQNSSENTALKDAISDGDLGKIYDALNEADFDYLFGIDPYQTDDYTKYMYSPYPLFRSGVTLIFKSKTIPPGYYLLTPREKNGKTYILFKENGKVSFCIPVYKTGYVREEYYQEKFPQAKLTAAQKTSKSFFDFIGTKWGKRNKLTPIPSAYIEFNDANMFWNMILYYGDKKYYLIFKKG